MGKTITLISILVFIDILFLVTGQLTLDSPTSVIIQSITNPSSIMDFNFWQLFITGITALLVAATVVVGIVTRGSDITIFIPMALGIGAMIGDYITVYLHLAAINNVLATILFVPLLVIFVIVIAEWVRGKD